MIINVERETYRGWPLHANDSHFNTYCSPPSKLFKEISYDNSNSFLIIIIISRKKIIKGRKVDKREKNLLIIIIIITTNKPGIRDERLRLTFSAFSKRFEREPIDGG